MNIPASESVAMMEQPYLLVTGIPCYRDNAEGLWLSQAWHQDVIEHTRYIRDLRLCAPSEPLKNPGPELIRIEVPNDRRIQLVALPLRASALEALRTLPRTVMTLWRAVGEAEIVHSGVIGWPYPLGWIANPFAVVRGKRLLVNVESSWRRGGAKCRTWKIKILNLVSEALARWSCRHADVALFTHWGYLESLLGGPRAGAYVMPAVWINEGDIVETATAELLWEQKVSEPVRLLFAGRMVADKGIEVLLAALRLLERRGLCTRVDFIGRGELRGTCQRAGESLRKIELSVLEPVPYGRPFFEVIQRYHALLVPSLSDEQPRIVFDAYAQAVCVIASDTAGLHPYVNHGETGWLVPPGDVEALAAMIERAVFDPSQLRTMGMAALAMARGFSHAAMHRTRAQILRQHFGSGRKSGVPDSRSDEGVLQRLAPRV